jgi:hypothetical protein
MEEHQDRAVAAGVDVLDGPDSEFYPVSHRADRRWWVTHGSIFGRARHHCIPFVRDNGHWVPRFIDYLVIRQRRSQDDEHEAQSRYGHHLKERT